MEKYLSWRVVPVTRTLIHSADRRTAVDELRDHLVAQGYPRRLHWLAAQAADELLSNAIFHGPVGAAGEHLRSETSRCEEFPLVGREQVRLRYGSDGRYFCLEVRDQYGSLDRQTLVSCLRRRSRADLNPRPHDAPGAGIGLSLTAGYVSHLPRPGTSNGRAAAVRLQVAEIASPSVSRRGQCYVLAHPGEQGLLTRPLANV
jgi:hypothetical protein